MVLYRVPLFLTVFITSLIVGYKTGENLDFLGEVVGHKLDTLSKPAIQIPDNHQFNFLIIGVDDIEQSDTQLKGIWLAAHAENSPNITLVPVFPSVDNPEMNIQLSKSFSIDDRRPHKEFWDALRETNFWWNGYIVIDRPTLISLTDELGGIDIHGQQMNGLEALEKITSWHDDSSAAVNQQKLFLESICNKFGTSQSTNRKEIIDLFEDGFRSFTQRDFTISRWIVGISRETYINCIFPTLSSTTLNSMAVTP